ncbi:PTS sugar transporter subunit IIA [Teichococcus aestuarii]|uniref:PTS sugar transporter subunit IIA n=1 Tax=Teichococcus aestuarii TaxID=568898 RepID=UPI00360F4A2D
MLAQEASVRLSYDGPTVLDALQARERLGSTALGRGVGLPHTRLEGLGTPLALLARLTRPIDFEARDGEPVDLVFMVLWPENSAEGFLPALSGICRVLRGNQLPRQLRRHAPAPRRSPCFRPRRWTVPTRLSEPARLLCGAPITPPPFFPA